MSSDGYSKKHLWIRVTDFYQQENLNVDIADRDK
jgi:hypothetical protein